MPGAAGAVKVAGFLDRVLPSHGGGPKVPAEARVPSATEEGVATLYRARWHNETTFEELRVHRP